MFAPPSYTRGEGISHAATATKLGVDRQIKYGKIANPILNQEPICVADRTQRV
jgi:hypothetical protein